MGSDQSHAGHHHGPVNFNRAFAVGIALNLSFVFIEALYGVFAHSLALLSDAGHNLSDVAGLLLACGAMLLAKRRPSQRRTYGLRRSSILAALANAVLLLIAVGAIAWEAVLRFAKPQTVAGGTVMVVAGIGIGVNAATALLFMKGRESDVNVEGAFLHMAADAAVSLGVIVAGAAIKLTGWAWLDPVTSLMIVAVIMWSTWGLLRKSVNLAMDAVPEGIDPASVMGYLAQLPGVIAVHDLHIWGMSTTETALTAHLVKPNAADEDDLLTGAAKELHDRFGIEHATIQIERADGHCRLAADEAV